MVKLAIYLDFQDKHPILAGQGPNQIIQESTFQDSLATMLLVCGFPKGVWLVIITYIFNHLTIIILVIIVTMGRGSCVHSFLLFAIAE